MQTTIGYLNNKGELRTSQRVLRHQRTFRGAPIAAIRDKNYLVAVRVDPQYGCWMPFRVIRKINK